MGIGRLRRRNMRERHGMLRGTFVGQDHENDISDLESRFEAQGRSGTLGKLNDQMFYAVRYQGGRPLGFPFASQKFGALLNLTAEVDQAELERIARELLEYGMAFALCAGEQAELMSQIIDQLIDENGFSHDGFTPYSSVEEGLSEAMQYFVLPTGVTQTSLIITIGNDNDQGSALDLFDNLFGTEAGIEEESLEDENSWLREVLAGICQTPVLV